MCDQDNAINNKAILLEKKIKELYELGLIGVEQLDELMNMLFSSGIAPTELIEAEYLRQLAETGNDTADSLGLR